MIHLISIILYQYKYQIEKLIESCKFYFIFLITYGNVINIKVSTTKLPLRHVP